MNSESEKGKRESEGISENRVEMGVRTLHQPSQPRHSERACPGKAQAQDDVCVFQFLFNVALLPHIFFNSARPFPTLGI